MENVSAINTILIIVTGLMTYQGLSKESYKDKYIFWIDRILISKENLRLISSGFLHGSWLHYGFNMIGLLAFGNLVEQEFGSLVYLLFYFVCLLGGSLLALWIHKNHGDYRALGASGAVSGLIFACIILFPEGEISLIFIPDVSMKNWVFGILFVFVTIFGIQKKTGNIGHEAHLGGALMGMIGTIFLAPQTAIDNLWILLLCLIPTLAFLIMIIRNPHILLMDGYWRKSMDNIRRDIKTPKETLTKEEELNQLLDKIRKSGIRSLTKKERSRLKELRENL